MLEGSTRHFKNWIENGEEKNLVLTYIGNDVLEVYEKFIKKVKRSI